MKLSGKVALVTGAAHRVGRVIALALAQEGADIVLHYGNSAEAARQTATEIEALGRRTLLLQANMGQWDEAKTLGENALAHFGHIDILINSASSFVSKNYIDTSEAEFDHAFDINIKGPFVLSQVISKAMMAHDWPEGEYGNIVNIVDEGAFTPWGTYAAHSLSKMALLGLTRVQAVDLGPKVRTNAICPGPILKPPTYTDTQWENLRNTNPLHALGTVEQMGEIVLFLVTGPKFINGDCIMLEGGRLWKHA